MPNLRRLLATFGNSQNGRLGHSIEVGGSLYPTVVPTLHDLNVKQTVCGGAHTAVLLDDGSVHTFGDNTQGQLGHSKEFSMTVAPREVPIPEPITSIAAGEAHTICISESGNIWVWGSNGDGQLGIGMQDKARIAEPRLVTALKGAGVVQVAAGAQHSMALTKGGEVLSWGNGRYGALGLGPGRTGVEWEPLLLRGLQGSGVRQVAAGYHHSGVVDGSGRAFTWGYNRFWQLGVGHDRNQHTPDQVPALSAVKQLALGFSHSMALSQGGRLAVWGTDEGGCLGLGWRWPIKPCLVPEPVPQAPLYESVAAGWKHCAGVTEAGGLYMWGWAGSPGGAGVLGSAEDTGAGQLGAGDDVDAYDAKQVCRLNVGGEGRFVDVRQLLPGGGGLVHLKFVQVSLGRNHSAVVVEVSAEALAGVGGRG